jgi:hypothetical protein
MSWSWIQGLRNTQGVGIVEQSCYCFAGRIGLLLCCLSTQLGLLLLLRQDLRSRFVWGVGVDSSECVVRGLLFFEQLLDGGNRECFTDIRSYMDSH